MDTYVQLSMCFHSETIPTYACLNECFTTQQKLNLLVNWANLVADYIDQSTSNTFVTSGFDGR